MKLIYTCVIFHGLDRGHIITWFGDPVVCLAWVTQIPACASQGPNCSEPGAQDRNPRMMAR